MEWHCWVDWSTPAVWFFYFSRFVIMNRNIKILSSVIYRAALSMMDDNTHVINMSPSTLPIKARPPEKFGKKLKTA